MKVRLSPRTQSLLHVGNARLALLTWLMARHAGGHVALRLDDTAEGTSPEMLEAVQADLAWLGLDWESARHRSAASAPTEDAVDRLKRSGRLYPCFESDEELNSKRDQRQRRGQAPIYDRAMLKLTKAQRAAAEAGGKRPYWRFLLSGRQAEWNDAVLGRQSVKTGSIGDPVLIRADGGVLPLLADVAEDIASGISHAVHGEDHLNATAVQQDIRAALAEAGLGVARPRLAHLPLLVAAGGGPLKQSAALTLRTLRADGIDPAALAGHLARLGTQDAPAPALPRALVKTFGIARFGRTAPRFDPASLLATNRAALRDLPFEAVRDRLPPAATAAFWLAVRDGLDLLREARGWWDVASGTIVPPLLDGEESFLKAALDHLPSEPWDDTTWSTWSRSVGEATGRAGPGLDEPLRLAVTGEDGGPALDRLLPLIGRSRVAERLRLAAA